VTSDDRLWWKAVSALREAETLAQLAPSVSGPADAPPTGDIVSWTGDWEARARRALNRAREFVLAPQKATRDIGTRIARRVHEGGSAIKRKIKGARKSLNDLLSDSRRLWVAGNAAAGIGLGVVVVIAAVVLLRRKG
jgi:hypothetical protein